MKTREAAVVFTPDSEELRYLPEGPYRCNDGRVSWVGIQSGPDSITGSLNVLDLATRQNATYKLAGRPGFAFPTRNARQFVIGMERSIVRFDISDGSSEILVDEGIESSVDGTIINDAVAFDGHLVFGCKDLAFKDKKAGLYLLRLHDNRLTKLANDQVCSNGKAVVKNAADSYVLYDIDTPSKQVVAWQLDVNAGVMSSPRVVIDLTAEPVFPDGMLMTPDGRSLIIAFYDPRNSEHGEAKQFDLATGVVQAIWRCPLSPRVTCPQLVERHGKIELLLTTADEGMAKEHRAKAKNAGCLFIGDTDFDALNDAPTCA